MLSLAFIQLATPIMPRVVADTHKSWSIIMKRIFPRALALGLLVLTALPIAAQPSGADAAAQIARARTGGRVLSVRPSNNPQHPGFKVKVLLNDGRVRVLFINPK